MKVLAAPLAAHVATRSTTLATALRITRGDGEVYAFTTHDIDEYINGVNYLSQPGLIITDIVITSGAEVGNLELRTLHDETVFTTEAVKNDRWRNAAFEIFRYNYALLEDNSPPSTDIDILLTGTVGEVKILKNEIIAELRDLRQYLQQDVGRASSQTCRDRLGGPRCRVRLDPPEWTALTAYTVRTAGDASTGSVVKTASNSPPSLDARHFKATTAGTSGASEPDWNGTIGGTTADGSVVWTTFQATTVRGVVTSVSGLLPTHVFQDTGRAEAANAFDEGEITMLTGDNAGVSKKIKSFAVGGEFSLALPFAVAIGVGDTYEAVLGCRKRHEEDCWDKFDNGLNIDAEPHRKSLNNLTGAPSTDVSEAAAAAEIFGGEGFF